MSLKHVFPETENIRILKYICWYQIVPFLENTAVKRMLQLL